MPRLDELTKVVGVSLGSVQSSYVLEPQDVAGSRFATEYELKFNAGKRASFEMGIQICRNDWPVTLFMQFSATIVDSDRPIRQGQDKGRYGSGSAAEPACP